MVRSRKPAKLSARLAALAGLHGEPQRSVPRTPFEWVLWENVAYLVDDARRERVFRELMKEIGRTAEAIDGATHGQLLAVTRLAGRDPAERARRLHECACIALEHGGGTLASVLELEPVRARTVLARFPGIGAPGAAKILSACGASPELALESNGLRVLLRLGYGEELGAYAKTYRSVIAAVAGEVREDEGWAWRAHRLLREHGRTICRNAAPACEGCPLAADCRHAAEDA